ncbi:ABC-type Fe3+/spermidine/putrescine transport system ATPase subunit [Bradyrhizobium diazoefficiens]
MEAGMVTLAPALVRFSGIQKTYDGEHLVVKNLDLDIRKGEFITLLGPSGSGKTTTLMMLAGFEVPTHGEIYLADRPIKNMPPHKRDIGMVFQNYALFPHLTIAENIAFPLSVRKINKAEAQERVRAALRMIKMETLAHRRPGQLSGGQQQRVALARALVFQSATRVDGRAPWRPRQAPAGADATRNQATARDDGHHRRLRHPRSE